MGTGLKCLVVDGYDRSSRDALASAGMKVAADLYVEMLHREVRDAQADVYFPSDPGAQLPVGADLGGYDAVLWTGCNATIYDDEPRIRVQIELAKKAYEVGTPQFGSCWGLQMAAVAAGGSVAANPNGREMGIARRIHLTDPGKAHPMMEGRSDCYEAFISHVDEVTGLPPRAEVLAGNSFTRIQALAVQHGKGIFWGVQYHPEYDLQQMARLTVARESKLIALGFYRTSQDLQMHVAQMEALHQEPQRHDLRWLLVADDDVLEPEIRTLEFRNFIHKVALPHAAAR